MENLPLGDLHCKSCDVLEYDWHYMVSPLPTSQYTVPLWVSLSSKSTAVILTPTTSRNLAGNMSESGVLQHSTGTKFLLVIASIASYSHSHALASQNSKTETKAGNIFI